MQLFIIVLCFGASFCDRGKSYLENFESRVYVENRGDVDNTTGIIRPCSMRDLNCIRRFFAQNSYCVPTYGPTPDPYPIPRLRMPIPNANMTFMWNNAQVKGLRNAEVVEFYINKSTNKLVFEIELTSISIFSPASIATYYRKGKEPIELSDYSFITYRMVSMTLIVPFVNGIEMDKAEVYSYIGVPRPSTNIGTGLSNADPEIQSSYNTMIQNIPISMREAFIVQGPIHMAVFLESNICSFRHNKISY